MTRRTWFSGAAALALAAGGAWAGLAWGGRAKDCCADPNCPPGCCPECPPGCCPDCTDTAAKTPAVKVKESCDDGPCCTDGCCPASKAPATKAPEGKKFICPPCPFCPGF